MAIGDVYELKVKWTYVGQECINVFHYELVSGTDPDHANSVVSAWSEDISPLVLNCTADTCVMHTIEAINLMDPTDFYVDASLARPGTIVSGATQSGASFLSYGYRLEKAHPGAPNGYKRFPGVAEGYTAENVYDPPNSATTFLKNALEIVINESSLSDIWQLVVVKRPWTVLIPPTLWWLVTAVTYTNLTSQNSRKF